MKKFLALLALILAVGSAYGQEDSYTILRKDATTGRDTLVAATKDTSGYCNLYPSSINMRGGSPCFFFEFTAIGSNTTHDSIAAVLRLNNVSGLIASDPTWCVIDTFYLNDYAAGALTDNECVMLVCDTLNDFSVPYASWVVWAVGGAAADSTKWQIKFYRDKGGTP